MSRAILFKDGVTVFDGEYDFMLAGDSLGSPGGTESVEDSFEGIFGVPYGTPRDPASGTTFATIDEIFAGAKDFRMTLLLNGVVVIPEFIMVENYGGLRLEKRSSIWYFTPIDAVGEDFKVVSGDYTVRIKTSKGTLEHDLKVSLTNMPPTESNITRLKGGGVNKYEYSWR